MADLLATARKAAKPSTKPQAAASALAWDYTPADLRQLEKLLRELGELEGWTEEERADALDHSRRMAPANVIQVLKELREVHKNALAGWPELPAKRAQIRLCRLVVIDGEKK